MRARSQAMAAGFFSDGDASGDSIASARYGGWLRFIFSTHHKDIGTMHLVFAILAGLAGGYLSVMMRAELMQPGLQIFADARAFDVFVTGHGMIMALYMIMPAMVGGFGNWLVPLMIGAPGMAFPRLNTAAFWLLPVSLAIFILSMFVESDRLSGFPGAATELVIAALCLAGVSFLLSAITIITTIFNLRAAEVTLHRMPLFVWSILVTAILLLVTLPVLAGAVGMLLADPRAANIVFGLAPDIDPLASEHLFWFFGSPEVYVLLIPGFGLVSQIVSTFSKQPVFGYLGMVYAMVALGFIGFVAWAHHLLAGSPASGLNAYFQFAVMVIAVPTSIQIFAWAATLWNGALDIRAPMLWAMGFIFLLTVGGLTSVVLANAGGAAANDNYYVVAHFHYMLSLGAVFAILAGWYYWFPKITGLLYNETLARQHFWLSFIGVNLTFIPMEFLGLAGMPRRYVDYPNAFAGWNSVASIGSYITAAGLIVFLIGMAEAFLRRRLAADNPWGSGATTREWTEPSSSLAANGKDAYSVDDGLHARIALSRRADSL